MTSRFVTLFWLALRNLGRELNRSLLTAAAMTVGLAMLIVSRTLSDGVHEDWIDAGVRLGSGHLVFQAPGYQESRSLDDLLDARQVSVCTEASGDLNIEGPPLMSVRLMVAGLASSANGAVPVHVMGVDSDVERSFSRLSDEVVEGRYLEEGDRLSAFIGQKLAGRLGLRVGSRMVLTAQAAAGSIEGQLVRVEGVFRTGLDELDEGLIHIPIETARSWLGAQGAASSVAVLLPHSQYTDEALTRAARDVGPEGVVVLGWRESLPQIDAAVRLDDAGDWVFHGILFVIIAVAILNAIFMSVLHRTRELGLLRALGLSRVQTGMVVFAEGVLLTMVSGLMGVALGFALTWVFFRNGLDLSGAMPMDFTFSGVVFDPVMHPVFAWRQVFQSLMLTMVIGLSAALYPAFVAARLDPAESVKFE